MTTNQLIGWCHSRLACGLPYAAAFVEQDSPRQVVQLRLMRAYYMLSYEKGCCLAAPALSALRRAGGVRLPLNSALPGSWVCSTPSFCAFNPTMHLTTHTGVLQPMGTSEPGASCVHVGVLRRRVGCCSLQGQQPSDAVWRGPLRVDPLQRGSGRGAPP